MAYLKNRDVNLMNLHYAFQAMAQGSGGVFLLVFLIKAGLSVPETLLALAGTVVIRFVTRLGVVPFASVVGVRTALIFGCILMGLQYPLSAQVQGLNWALLARCAVSGMGEAFYWSSYHAYFAALGDSDSRGHQVSAREALAAAIGILAPLFGAWSITTLGALPAFALIGLVQACGALPLLGTPDVRIARHVPSFLRVARLGIGLFALHGWFAATFILIWQVALFRTLGESLTAFGGTMSLAAIAGAAGGLLLGKRIDSGRGAATVSVVLGAIMLVTVLRAASLGNPQAAIAANVIGTFAICFYVPTLMAPLYNLAKASPCTLRFHVATESAWDVGCVIASLLAAAVAAAGFSLAWIVLLTLPATASQAWLLNRHYRRQVPQA
jgi:hypothetical protein